MGSNDLYFAEIMSDLMSPIMRSIMGPLGVVDDVDYLIRSGVPQNATFERTGDILRDGVTFAQDEPVVQGGKYWHNGTFTNLLPYSVDMTQYDARVGITPYTDGRVTYDGSEPNPDAAVLNMLIAISGGTAGKTFVASFYASAHTYPQTFRIKNTHVGVKDNFSEDIILEGPGDHYLAVTNSSSTGAGSQIFGLAAATDNAPFDIRVDGLCYEGKYPISPITIPTTGAPASIDTAASAPNPDKHGLNWEFSDPKNAWAWDLLDGRADGVNLIIDGDFPDGTTAWTLGAGWSISGGTANSDNTSININQFVSGTIIGSRYEVSFDVLNFISGSIRSEWRSAFGNKSFENGRNITRYDNSSSSTSPIYLYGETGYTGSIDNVAMKEISPATGTLNLKGLSVVPAVTEWQTVGVFNILSGDDNSTVEQIIYIEETTGLFCAKDDADNICKSTAAYTANTDHDAELHFDETQMWWVLDGVEGTKVTFSGRFSVGVTLKWGYLNEDIFSIANIYPGTV